MSLLTTLHENTETALLPKGSEYPKTINRCNQLNICALAHRLKSLLTTLQRGRRNCNENSSAFGLYRPGKSSHLTGVPSREPMFSLADTDRTRHYGKGSECREMMQRCILLKVCLLLSCLKIATTILQKNYGIATEYADGCRGENQSYQENKNTSLLEENGAMIP